MRKKMKLHQEMHLTLLLQVFFSIIFVHFVHILHIYHLTIFFYYYRCKGEVNEVLHTPLCSLSKKTRTPQIKVWGQPKLFALVIIHLKRLYQPASLFIYSFILLQSFRIRTPPSPEIKGSWKKNILKLDPKSDNSESNDILVNCIYCHSIRIPLVLCCAINRLFSALLIYLWSTQVNPQACGFLLFLNLLCRVSLQDLLNQRNLCSQKTQTLGVWTWSRR